MLCLKNRINLRIVVRNQLVRIQFGDKNCFFKKYIVIFCLSWIRSILPKE